MSCSVEGCGKPVKGRGLCPGHYQRWRRYGDAQATPYGIEERLLSRREITADGCWLYTRRLDVKGYGRIGHRGWTNLVVHRVAYELWVGPLPAQTEPDHTCHDPLHCTDGPTCPHRRCFNPEHLEWVDHRTNVLRGNAPAAVNARKTHCKHGHAFTPENTLRFPSSPNRRTCRTCKALRGAAAWRAKAARTTR